MPQPISSDLSPPHDDEEGEGEEWNDEHDGYTESSTAASVTSVQPAPAPVSWAPKRKKKISTVDSANGLY